MTEWKRVPTDTLCGYCLQTIAEGDPARFTKLPNVKRERVRCEGCVGAAPPNLPLLIATRKVIEPSFTKVAHVLPTRTRGELRNLTTRRDAREWMPYRESE